MAVTDTHEILIGCLSTNISTSIFKYANQQDIIIVAGQVWLNVLKVTYHNGNVILLLITVCIDQASLL